MALNSQNHTITKSISPDTNKRGREGRDGREDHAILDLSDQRVFRSIWYDQKESLFWIAQKILDNEQEAQDVVTEVFVKLFHSTAVFPNEAAVCGWLRVAVRNRSLTLLSQNDIRKSRLNELSTMLYNVETQWGQDDVLAELLKLLYTEIQALPQKTREVFELRYFDKLTNEEIAQRLGTSDQVVRNYLARAFKKLRVSMKQYNHLLGVLVALLGQRN